MKISVRRFKVRHLLLRFPLTAIPVPLRLSLGLRNYYVLHLD
ncbi:MAG: hypothetical protein AB1502_02335 [Thermodesulfobacteriota bacterium]